MVLREAIVPAFNEAQSIVEVVAVLVRSGCFSRVVVVDDGSSDNTAFLAKWAGAHVITQKNQGKAEAMLTGLLHTTSDPVAFFDADFLNLQEWHIRRLAALADKGYDMVCGLQEYGVMGNTLSLAGPLITGQRFVKRHLMAAVSESCWKGYSIETAMNHASRVVRARTAVTLLPGLKFRGKTSKTGLVSGIVAQSHMFSRIVNSQENLVKCGECEMKR